jgi:hypothetical protein
VTKSVVGAVDAADVVTIPHLEPITRLARTIVAGLVLQCQAYTQPGADAEIASLATEIY